MVKLLSKHTLHCSRSLLLGRAVVVNFLSLLILCLYQSRAQAQIIYEESTSYVEPIWQKVTDGECAALALNYDYQNDGTIEYVYSTHYQTLQIAAGFGFGWEMRKYNPSNQEYEVIYTSNLLEEWHMADMLIADLGDDGEDELILAGNRNIFIYSLSSLKQLACIELGESTYDVWTLQYGDVDNDSSNELVVSGQKQLVIFNGQTLEKEATILDIDAADFRLGNVDDDNAIELVFGNGSVLEFAPDGSYIMEYQLLAPDRNMHNHNIQLLDIDGDNREEAIFLYEQSLQAYDVETSSLVYEYETIERIGPKKLKLADINGDGSMELYYSFDSFLNNLYFHNAATGELLLEHETVNGNPRAIRIADYDQDGAQEMIISDNCSSSAPTVFTVSDVLSNDLEYDSAPRFSSRRLNFYGGIYNLCIEDFDQDDSYELATMTHDGILNVYNTESHDLVYKKSEYQSGNLEVHNLQAFDYNTDGVQDIILADGERLVFINGTNFEFDFFKYYRQVPGHGFKNLEVIDLENDSRVEFLTNTSNIHVNHNTSSFGSKVMILDSEDYTELWSRTIAGEAESSSAFGINLNDDPTKEIVICMGKVYNLLYPSTDVLETIGSTYSCVAPYGLEDDLQFDLVAGTRDGSIHFLNGEDLALMDSLVITKKKIDNLEYLDHNNDGRYELYAIADHTLFRISEGSKIDSINIFGTANGRYDAFEFIDIDNDEVDELFVGGAYRFQQVDLAAFACNDFETNVIAENPDCSDSSWILNLSANEEISQILINSFEQGETVSPLVSGNYSVLIENELGCQDIYHVELKNDTFQSLSIMPFDITCGTRGSARPILRGGNLPFRYEWSNGDTTEILRANSTGTYSLTVTDATNCSVEGQVEVGEVDGAMDLVVIQASCRADNAVFVGLSGNHSFAGEYLWNGVPGPNPNQDLPPGNYLLEVTDINGCRYSEEFVLEEPSLDFFIIKEDVCEGDSTGYLRVSPSGGFSPYNFIWSDPSLEGRENTDLGAGSYSVTVEDRNGCSGSIDIIIEDLEMDTFYRDQDGDGFGGDQELPMITCYPASGYVTNNDDCDDANREIYPGAEETPDNGIDEDCDGKDLSTSVHELSGLRVNIYPNPSSGQLSIDVDGQLDYRSTIYDLSGRLVYSQYNNSVYDLGSLPGGVYQLVIEDLKTGEKIVERIIKTE